MENHDLSPAEYYQVIRPAETARMMKTSDRHLRRLEKEGKFPKRVKLNPDAGQQGASGHFFGAIVDHLKALAAEHDGGDDARASG